MYTDSLDKVVRSYFAAVTNQVFHYKGETYEPLPLRVSPGIFRGYTCPPNCGGCCSKFSLVYIPSEVHPTKGNIEITTVEFNGEAFAMFIDEQRDNPGDRCRHLDSMTGRCGIYNERPFTCDFELLRVSMRADRAYLNQQLFGRGWAMRRVDGGRGALCEMTPVDEHWRDEAVRKMTRLKEWTDYFGLRTRIPSILSWLRTGPHTEPVYLLPGVTALKGL